jgi:IMP dehydrogenase
MPNLINSNALTFDDVLLVPQYSDISSRKKVDISTDLLGALFSIPICSANMDTITEATMAIEMYKLGGLGFLHRYAGHEAILQWLREIETADAIAIPSIGIKSEDFEYALKYAEYGSLAVNVDIAHGDSEHMIKMVKNLHKEGIYVVAGNVATFEGALRLMDAGAKVIKVGIGPGSLCTTRIVTGHGVPQLTAIESCAQLKKSYNVKIIADGGIRSSGDCVKALAFGADMVMVGSLFAGARETPGECVNNRKAYRGMASRSARSLFEKIDTTYVPEGESKFVDSKGNVKDIVNQLTGGIRSGFSYSGAHNLKQLQKNCSYVIVTNNGVIENRPHGL